MPSYDAPSYDVPSYDVIVVGARCAGSALALLLARRGRRVLVVDRAQFPSDTVSTHFLWPRTTAFLHAWGLLDRLATTGCPPIEQVRMHWGPVVVAGRPEPVGGTSVMFCPRRTVLDALLVGAARDSGAEVREQTTVVDLLFEDGRVAGIRAKDAGGRLYEERATITIGADGAFSKVARATGAAFRRSHPTLTCGYYAYWSGVPVEGVEFYIREGRDVLVFPTHDAQTCVWVGRSSEEWPDYRANVEARYLDGLDGAIRARLDAGRRMSPFRGTGKLPNYFRQCHGEGWALVGDAAYHRDPLTGMGIGDAFLGADLLAGALEAGLASSLSEALAGYERALEEQTAAAFDYTLQAASLKDPGPLVPLYAAIAGRPEPTQQLMNVLAGSAPAKSLFNARNVARLMSGRAGDTAATASAAGAAARGGSGDGVIGDSSVVG
ncbi:MAG: NAD(P)/FAD-dependent oxidoreductase [Reyranella sp.]|nr:NAD(P)/FAD-dependent oxidoreductase [Reyranella sp.]